MMRELSNYDLGYYSPAKLGPIQIGKTKTEQVQILCRLLRDLAHATLNRSQTLDPDASIVHVHEIADLLEPVSDIEKRTQKEGYEKSAHMPTDSDHLICALKEFAPPGHRFGHQWIDHGLLGFWHYPTAEEIEEWID